MEEAAEETVAGEAAKAEEPPSLPAATASAEPPADSAAAANEAAVVIEESEAHPLTTTITPATTVDSANATTNVVALDVGDDEVVLLTKSDKAVSTNDTLEDLQRALTYEIIFSALFERKLLAIKRECEERKRAKRMKRKSIGRIFFSKRFFGGTRKAASCRGDSEPELFVRGELGGSSPQVYRSPKTAKKSGRRPADDIEVASASTTSHRSAAAKALKCKTKAATAVAQAPADDSVASTLSNSSGKNGVTAPPKRSLLVRAQTHTPAERVTSSSSSGDSKEPAHTRRSATITANGNGLDVMALPVSLLERTYDTTSLASGYDNGTGARMHTSTMADDSLTSLRDSIESLSFASSRYTVSFGGTEIIPEDTASLLYERARAARRLRVLEAKSISAQCSPIFPRHLVKSVPAPPTSPPASLPTLPAAAPVLPARATQPAAPSTVAQFATTAATAPLPVASATSVSVSAPAPPPATSTKITQTKQHIFPRQVSYTESMYGYVGVSADLDAAYTRYFSRQNTSEESANLTVSTMLNQSDSLSLHAPVGYASAERDAGGRPFALADRYKSKSTSLLVVASNGRTRPPPPPTLPLTTTTATATAPVPAVPSNISHSEQLVDSTRTNAHAPNAQLTSHPATLTSTQPQPAPTPAPAPASALYQPTVSTTALVGVDGAGAEAIAVGAFRHAPANGVIVPSVSVPDDTAKLNRMTSTSTGSSVAPTGCCTTTKSSSREKDKQRFKPHWPSGQSGSDDEYRRRKRKYKRYHRCSDPVLVYPSPSGLQHCILSMPPNEPVQFQYNEDFAFDMQIQMESDKNDDLEEIVPSSHRRHRRHRHHRHKKRHRHKKPKILVQDLETQVVKVIDPDDLPQRARWTIIATACLLLLMCLMLVGITLRMAPIIDDMGKSPLPAISFAISDCSSLLPLPPRLF